MLRRAVLAGLLLLAVGCGVQQIAPANRGLMLQLQSVTSSKKTEWLNEAVRQIEEQRSTGALSDAEFAAFEPIIKKARAGDWESAQLAAFALSDGQKPTAEDLERLEKREIK